MFKLTDEFNQRWSFPFVVATFDGDAIVVNDPLAL
jgi:hypothetical protein